MADIVASDTFDEDDLEPEVYQDIEPLVEWININMQSIVQALQGGLGDKNLTSETFFVQATNGVRQSVATTGEISNVQVSRVESQPDSKVVLTGLNWWPTEAGFDFVAQWSGDKKDRRVLLRVDFNV